MRELEDLCRLCTATEGPRVTVEELRAELRELARDDELWEECVKTDADEVLSTLKEMAEDDTWWLARDDWPVGRVVPQLPEPDPELLAELHRLRDELDHGCLPAIQEEVPDATAVADPAAALSAASMLQRQRRVV